MKKYLVLLLLTGLIAWIDLPSRLAAERNGAKKATVVEYQSKGSIRAPWIAIAETTEGERISNDDRWMFKWFPVGTEIEWTASKKRYFGGPYFRWSIYLTCAGAFFIVGLRDLIQKIKVA